MNSRHFPTRRLIEQAVRQETRRQFFARSTHGLGVAALTALLGEETTQGAVARRRRGQQRRGESASFQAKGQARHLSAHGRSTAADGNLRLQTQDGRVVG